MTPFYVWQMTKILQRVAKQIWFFSKLVGESLVNFQCEIAKVMEAVCLAFNDLDLVVNPFEFSGMNVKIAVIQYAIPIPFQHTGKAGQRRVLDGSCQGTPVVQ